MSAATLSAIALAMIRPCFHVAAQYNTVLRRERRLRRVPRRDWVANRVLLVR